MVSFKNVVVQFAPIVQAILAGGVRDNPALGMPWQVEAYVEHLTPGETIASYGIELNNPAMVQIEVADVAAVVAAYNLANPGHKITLQQFLDLNQGLQPDGSPPSVGGATQMTVMAALGGFGAMVGNVYHVRGRLTPYDDGLAADHILGILDRVMYPIGAPAKLLTNLVPSPTADAVESGN